MIKQYMTMTEDNQVTVGHYYNNILLYTENQANQEDSEQGIKDALVGKFDTWFEENRYDKGQAYYNSWIAARNSIGIENSYV